MEERDRETQRGGKRSIDKDEGRRWGEKGRDEEERVKETGDQLEKRKVIE